jgi:hypothetical protein
LDVRQERNQQRVDANSGKEAPEPFHPIGWATPG